MKPRGRKLLLPLDVCQGCPGPASRGPAIGCTSREEGGPYLALAPSCGQRPASLTDSDRDRVFYQNRSRTIVGLEKSSLREIMTRHFKQRELSATHSWRFLFMASNNRPRCKGGGGAPLSEGEALARSGRLRRQRVWVAERAPSLPPGPRVSGGTRRGSGVSSRLRTAPFPFLLGRWMDTCSPGRLGP